MDYINIILVVIVIAVSIFRYIAKAFNETPTTATAPPISPGKIMTEKKAKPIKSDIISGQQPTTPKKKFHNIPTEEGLRTTVLPKAASATRKLTPAESSTSQIAAIRHKSEAKKAFLYAEIFNRKYT